MSPPVLPAKPAPGTFGKEVGLFEERPFLRSSYCLGALGSQTGHKRPRIPGQTEVVCPWGWYFPLNYHVEFRAAMMP